MTQNTRVWVASLIVGGWMLGGPGLRAAERNYPLQLQTPKLESLATSLSPTGGAVVVQVQLRYDSKGSVVCTGVVDNLSATCKGTVKSTAAGTTYKFSLRTATTPPSVVSLSGTVGQLTALCSYSGPKGRLSNASNNVNVTATQPVPAHLRFSPSTSDKNLIAGPAQLEAGYSPNLTVAGTVKGKVTSNSVSLQIKQDKRMALYNGVRQGDVYVGPLRVTIPPAKETILNYAVPVLDLPLASGSAIFRGTLSTLSNRLPVGAVGAVVTLRSDLNGDGKFLGREILRGIANAQGRYEIKAAVVRGRTVLLEIRSPGMADVLVSYPSVTPGTVVTKNANLQPLNVLSVAGGTAEARDGSILLDGLPEEVESVQARVFNPQTESSQFPGQFADDTGNRLVSSVFAAVEATDGAGRSVTNLGTNATLCLRVPQDSWVSMGDLEPGNGKIDVPLYYYDEESGQWKRHSSNGWLEDANRLTIAEESLGAIRDGSYAGEVFVAGRITHLSWWNLVWPISTHSSVHGVLVTDQGQPVSGASVLAFGLTYNGTSGPEMVVEDGKFCLDIMRSETSGEDLDRDGVEAETHQVQLKVQYGTNAYAFGPFASPTTAGSCGAGGLDAGTLMLSAAHQLTPTTCTITGQVVYSGISFGGTPVSPLPGAGVIGATVAGFDPEALDLSNGTCSNCFTTVTDSFGRFTLQVQVVSGVTLAAYASRNAASGFGVFAGTTTVAGRPTNAVTLPVDYHNLGSLIVSLYDNHDDFIGACQVSSTAIQATMYPNYPDLNPTYYGSRISEGVPFQTGFWAAFPLGNLNNGFTQVGLFTLTVTRLVPLAGTWKLEGATVKLSGRWNSSFSGEF